MPRIRATCGCKSPETHQHDLVKQVSHAVNTLRTRPHCTKNSPIRWAAIALCIAASSGCDSSAAKSLAPGAVNTAESEKTQTRANSSNLDDYPVEPISIEEMFKQKAVEKFAGKRVTWRCVIERVTPFNDNWPGFTATGFPLEFEGLKAPAEDKEHLGEYSKRYNEYAKKEIARVSQTVQFTFSDRPSYEKLKYAKGKHATISGIVSPGPMNGSADLKGCRVVSVE